jgi:hypothetical protein
MNGEMKDVGWQIRRRMSHAVLYNEQALVEIRQVPGMTQAVTNPFRDFRLGGKLRTIAIIQNEVA